MTAPGRSVDRARVTRLLMLSAASAAMWLPVHGYFRVLAHLTMPVPEPWTVTFLAIVVRTLRWVTLTPIAIVAAQRLPLQYGRRGRNLACLVLLVACLAVITPPLSPGMPRDYPALVNKLRSAATPNSVMVAVLAVMFGYILAGWEESRAQYSRRLELERSVSAIREEQLRTKLGPQFLFGALDTLVNTIRSEPVRAEAAVVDLSDLLRRVLYLGQQEGITTAQELDVVNRFAGTTNSRLRVTASDDALETSMPPLIVFAIVASFVPQSPPEIAIDAATDTDRLRIEVTITRAASVEGDVPRELLTVEERLQRLYGQNAPLLVQLIPCGVHIALNLPLALNPPKLSIVRSMPS